MRPRGARFGTTRPRALHPEDDLQMEIVAFHARCVRQCDAVLFAVPNGERRDGVTAARLTGMAAGVRDVLPDDICLRPAGLGVLPGASDLVLLLARGGTMLIEVKIPKTMRPGATLPLFDRAKGLVLHRKSGQSRGQKRFQAGVEALGHTYRLVRSVDEYAELLEGCGVPLHGPRPWGPGVGTTRPPAPPA